MKRTAYKSYCANGKRAARSGKRAYYARIAAETWPEGGGGGNFRAFPLYYIH